MSNSLNNNNALTPNELKFAAIIIVGIAIPCLPLRILGKAYWALALWLCLSLAAFFVTCLISQSSSVTRRIPFLEPVGEFGRKIWDLPNLWFIVLVVGIYVSIIGWLQQVTGKPPSPFEIGQVLILIRDLALAIFFALVTSVMASTFTRVGRIEHDFLTIEEKAEEAVKHTTNALDKAEQVRGDLTHTIATLESICNLTKYTARIHGLTLAVLEVSKRGHEKSLETRGLTGAINILNNGINSFNNIAMRPLLPEQKQSLAADSDLGSAFNRLLEDIKVNKKCQQHCAYMAVAQGRYLEAEAEERSFPGVLLNITSFAYYVRTVQQIVEALQAWPQEFEFYTLMPRTPAVMLRFSNALDLDEWLRFLEYYHEYNLRIKRGEDLGPWIRYFAYAPSKDYDWVKEYDYWCLEEIQCELARGYVKCVDASEWKPKSFNENSLGDMLNNEFSNEQWRKIVEDQNMLHGGKGTCVVIDKKGDSEFNKTLMNLKWPKLRDAIKAFHVEEKNFRYRDVRGLEELFGEPLVVESQRLDEEINDMVSGRLVEIPFPKDLFAVRRVSPKRQEKDWILLIGLDERFVTLKGSGMKLPFSPVLDLEVMSRSGGQNSSTAASVRKSLHKIFFPKNAEEVVFEHEEFMVKHNIYKMDPTCNE